MVIVRDFAFAQREDGRVGDGLADFKVALHAGRIGRRGHVLPVPLVGCLGQLGALLAHGPRGTLVEADAQRNVEVGVVGGVESGHVIVGHGVVNLSLCHLGDELFGRDAVAGHGVDLQASTQLVVEVVQPVEVLAWFGIDFLAYQLRHVAKGLLVSAALALHDDLVCNHLLAAILHAIFPLLGDGQVVGYQVSLAPPEHGDELRRRLGHLHGQLHPQAACKLLAELVLKPHLLTAVDEVGGGAVEGEHHQFVAVAYLLQVVVSIQRSHMPMGAARAE